MSSGFRLKFVIIIQCLLPRIYGDDEVFFARGRKALDDGYAFPARRDPVDGSLFSGRKDDDQIWAAYR